MKLSIISFGTNPRLVAKFQTDRFRTFGENRGEKRPRLVNHIRSPLLRYAVAGGVNNIEKRMKYDQSLYQVSIVNPWVSIGGIGGNAWI